MEQQEQLLWSENKDAVEWWLSIPDFLRFNNNVCMGMNVQSVHADALLSSRNVDSIDYQKLKLIARTQASFLNKSLSKKSP